MVIIKKKFTSTLKVKISDVYDANGSEKNGCLTLYCKTFPPSFKCVQMRPVLDLFHAWHVTGLTPKLCFSVIFIFRSKTETEQSLVAFSYHLKHQK
jgi:hypothetical protein